MRHTQAHVPQLQELQEFEKSSKVVHSVLRALDVTLDALEATHGALSEQALEQARKDTRPSAKVIQAAHEIATLKKEIATLTRAAGMN